MLDPTVGYVAVARNSTHGDSTFMFNNYESASFYAGEDGFVLRVVDGKPEWECGECHTFFNWDWVPEDGTDPNLCPRCNGRPWYEYDEPQYAPDGAHCPRCNFFTEKPHKWHSGCAACDSNHNLLH